MTDVIAVTANPAVDHTIWVPNFRAGQVNRVRREDVTPGGKGVNVAADLSAYGLDVYATGLLGTANAALFEAFLDARGIAHAFVAVDGATRTGIKVADDARGETTDINFPGFTVDAGHLEALGDAVAAAASAGVWVVLAGGLPVGAPADTYRRLAEIVAPSGALVALDTSGPALAEGLRAAPALVKPNREELEELVGRTLADEHELIAAAQELGAQTVVVSMGADGALFVRDGEAVLAVPPPVTVASTVGAGDAMVSGTIAGLREGLALEQTAALATAFSAVKISRVGQYLDPVAVRDTAARVTVKRLERSGS